MGAQGKLRNQTRTMAGLDPSLALGERIEDHERAIFLDLSPGLIGTKVMSCQESATFNFIEESYKQCLGNHRLLGMYLTHFVVCHEAGGLWLPARSPKF